MSRTPYNHRRQLRNYLLDRKVQLKITLVMVVLTSLLTAGLGWAWYAEVRNASGVIQVNALSTLGPEVANSLADELARQDQWRLLVLVGFGLLLAVLVVGQGIIMTHKIAGPLFKIRRYLGDIEQGRLGKIFGLRRGDQLQDFYAAFERMHEALRAREEEDQRLLERLQAAIEGGQDLKGELPELRRAIEAKRACLHGQQGGEDAEV